MNEGSSFQWCSGKGEAVGAELDQGTVTLLFATKIDQDSEPRRNQRKLWEIWRQQCLLKTREGKKVNVKHLFDNLKADFCLLDTETVQLNEQRAQLSEHTQNACLPCFKPLTSLVNFAAWWRTLSLSHSIYITAFIFRLQLLEVSHESRQTHAFTSMYTLWQYIKDTCKYIILTIDSSYTIVDCRRWWWSLQLSVGWTDLPTWTTTSCSSKQSHVSLGIDGCISHCPGQDWAFKIRLRSLKKSKYMKHRI